MSSKICTKCSVEKPLSEYHVNKTTLDGKSSRCKKCSNADTKRSYKTRGGQFKCEEVKKRQNPIYRAQVNIRQRIWRYIKNKGWVKESSYTKSIGCSSNEFVKHIEGQFDDKMNWANYGDYWEIDHILPLSSAKTINEVYKLNHYTNLQPLYWEDNRKKGDKII